jgi:hypothetical protein
MLQRLTSGVTKVTDSIEDGDVRRVDQNVDPTALNSQDIEESIPDDFSSEAKQEFAERVSRRRSGVSQEAQQTLVENISEPGANGRRQLYGIDSDSGRNTFVGTASNVTSTVDDDGTVYGVNTNTGTRAEIGQIDLDRGAEGRADNW